MYKVIFSKKADKELSKLDKKISTQILNWIKENLEGCINPKFYGKGLKGEHSGEWRYRIGSYRVIAEIQNEIITILVLRVGHRGQIYD